MYSKEEVLLYSHPWVILDRDLHPHIASKIRVALHLTEKKYYATKRLIKCMLNNLQWDNLHRGITIHKYLSSFQNSGVVQLFDVIEDSRCFYLIMEALDGDLITLIEKRLRLDEEEAKMIFKKAVDIVHFIHSHDIAHRDLKPDNFLFCWDPSDYEGKVMEVKLTDFNLANHLKDEPFHVPCGSPAYTAPEVCTVNPHYKGRQTDIWSIGVLLYLLVCGSFPWYDQDMITLFDKIRYEPLLLPSYLSSDVKDLLNKLLTKDPDQRITIPQIQAHPWLCGQR